MNVEAKVPFSSAKVSRRSCRQEGINHRDWLPALAQLSEYHLIDWTALEDQSGMGLLSGVAKINDFGSQSARRWCRTRDFDLYR